VVAQQDQPEPPALTVKYVDTRSVTVRSFFADHAYSMRVNASTTWANSGSGTQRRAGSAPVCGPGPQGDVDVEPGP
jgi:hypothetical protein